MDDTPGSARSNESAPPATRDLVDETTAEEVVVPSGDEIAVQGYDGAVGYEPTVEEANADRVTDTVLAVLTSELPGIRAWLESIDRGRLGAQALEIRQEFEHGRGEADG